MANSLLCLEGDAHHRLRSLCSKAFTPRTVARLHDTMIDVLSGLVDQVADAGHCDVVDEMVGRRRHSLTDDLIFDLIRAEDDGNRLDAAELRMLAGGLLLAGTDTARNQVAASVQVLCEHPEQWELLNGRPDLAVRAVEETMRHSPIASRTLRLADWLDARVFRSVSI